MGAKVTSARGLEEEANESGKTWSEIKEAGQLLPDVLLQRGTGIVDELNGSVKIQRVNNKCNNSLQIKLGMCSHNETIACVEYKGNEISICHVT
jgi:hypothetical protein